MAYNLLVVIVLVVFSTCSLHTTLAAKPKAPAFTAADQTHIQQGIALGVGLAEAIRDLDFGDTLKKLGTNLAGFLGVIGPLLSIVISFIPTEDSAELAYMKAQFEVVNEKLDVILDEFEEVKRAIDWSAIKVSFGTYERKIRAADANLRRIFTYEGANREDEKENFIIQYESDFDNSVQNLYEATVKDDHIFSTNILAGVVKQTKYHKKQVETFSLGLVKLLVQGIRVKISYYSLKNWSAQHMVDEWGAKMGILKSKLTAVSNQVKDSYPSQMRIDAEDIIIRFTESSNEEVMNEIYSFMREKYDWRYFFVAVYDDIIGEDKHNMAICAAAGDSFLHLGGRNTIIVSQDNQLKSENNENEARARLVQKVVNDVNRCAEGLRPGLNRAQALVEKALLRFEGNRCSPNVLYLAVTLDSGFQSINSNGHRSQRSLRQRSCSGTSFAVYGGSSDDIYWNHDLMIFS